MSSLVYFRPCVAA